jgi:signal transduction histidine kinase
LKNQRNINNEFNRIEFEQVKEENKKNLITPLKFISVLTIISGLFALVFEVKYFLNVSIYVYAFRFFVITIAFWILILSSFEFGKKYPVLLSHSLLISILLSFGAVIILLPTTIIVNSQISALIIFTASLFLSWEVKNQIVVAIYYNLIFGSTILINKSEVYFQQNIFASVLFILFLSVMSVAIAAINYKYRRTALLNTFRLIDSQRKFQEIFENSMDGIFQASLDGKVIISNTTFKKMFCLKDESPDLLMSDEKFIGKNNFDTILNLMIQGKQLKDLSFKFDTNSSEIKHFNLSCHLRNDSTLGAYLIEGTIRDITPQIKIEESLRLAKDKAEKSDKLKSTFLSQMSHEIRTPVNAILSSIEYLRDELQNEINEEVSTTFKIIDSSSRRIIRTIHLMLNHAELQSGTYKYMRSKFDLYSDCMLLISKEYDDLLKEKEIILNIHKITDDSNIIADEYSVSQIFNNLIDNAIKYTHVGGIDVLIDRDDDGRPTVEVIDTGIGISSDYLPNLFKSFTQEEQGFTRKYDGNGLGLSLVKKYCELNNATVNVSSRKHEGTRVKVTFHNPGEIREKIKLS